MNEHLENLRQRLAPFAGSVPKRLIRVCAGDVAAVGQSIPADQRTKPVAGILTGALACPPGAEVYQQYGDLSELIRLADR